jgi:hypothetical protein
LERIGMLDDGVAEFGPGYDGGNLEGVPFSVFWRELLKLDRVALREVLDGEVGERWGRRTIRSLIVYCSFGFGFTFEDSFFSEAR